MSLGQAFMRSGAVGNLSWQRPTQFGRVNFELFFDRQLVLTRLDRKEQRVLGGTGSWGRGFMRRQIKPGGKKGKQSLPGRPPRYHTRGFGSLKDGIFFQADLAGGSVAIGPNKLKTNVRPTGGLRSTAELIDIGGTGDISSWRFNKGNRAGSWKRRRGRWRARPFTEPAKKPIANKMLELMQKFEL